MTWIRTILPAEATDDLKDIYEKTQSPHGTVDNVYISNRSLLGLGVEMGDDRVGYY